MINKNPRLFIDTLGKRNEKEKQFFPEKIKLKMPGVEEFYMDLEKPVGDREKLEVKLAVIKYLTKENTNVFPERSRISKRVKYVGRREALKVTAVML